MVSIFFKCKFNENQSFVSNYTYVTLHTHGKPQLIRLSYEMALSLHNFCLLYSICTLPYIYLVCINPTKALFPFVLRIQNDIETMHCAENTFSIS